MLFRVCLILLPIAAGLCGCDFPKSTEVDEQKNPHFVEGKERTKARDVKGAIEAFQHALEANPNSALAHFELGMLYEKLDEPTERRYVLALYHYYRAYELRPNAYPADNARLRIQACRQELAKAESLAPLYPAMQRELEKLREENSQFRRQIEFLQAQALARHTTVTNPQPAAATGTEISMRDRVDLSRPVKPVLAADRTGSAATGRKHTVKERETLASIARLYRLRLETLIAANPSIEPKRLRAGQTVNIPPS